MGGHSVGSLLPICQLEKWFPINCCIGSSPKGGTPSCWKPTLFCKQMIYWMELSMPVIIWSLREWNYPAPFKFASKKNDPNILTPTFCFWMAMLGTILEFESLQSRKFWRFTYHLHLYIFLKCMNYLHFIKVEFCVKNSDNMPLSPDAWDNLVKKCVFSSLQR